MRTPILAPSILSMLEAPAESFFGIFRSSAVAFDLMSSMVAKRVALRPIFRVGKSQKTLGASSTEYGGWVMKEMLFSARGHVSQPWRTSNRMRRPNCGNSKKKPSAGVSRMEQVCVCVGGGVRAQGSYFEGDQVSVVLCPTITVLYHNSRNVLTALRIIRV